MISCQNLQVFGRIAITDLNHLIPVFTEDDFSVLLPGLIDDFSIGHTCCDSRDQQHHFICDVPIVGHQPNRRVRTMLGLRDQINRNSHRICTRISNDCGFSGSSQHINADFTK